MASWKPAERTPGAPAVLEVEAPRAVVVAVAVVEAMGKKVEQTHKVLLPIDEARHMHRN
jgi:hypothetical protein